MLYSSSRVQVFKSPVPINLTEKRFSMEPLDDLSATVSLLKSEPNDVTTLKKPEYLPSKGYLIFDRTDDSTRAFCHSTHEPSSEWRCFHETLALDWRQYEQGFCMTHTYGLSETYRPSVVCAWKEEWDSLPPTDRARMNTRQGVRYISLEGLDVVTLDSMVPVPADGSTVEEIVMRGNMMMKGYLRNPEANWESFRGGWFHSGDLAVKHPDGYIEHATCFARCSGCVMHCCKDLSTRRPVRGGNNHCWRL